jgi:hypothetical protein
MSKLAKLGLVIGGYVAACLVAGGVVYVYQWTQRSKPLQGYMRLGILSSSLVYLAFLHSFKLVLRFTFCSGNS